MSDPVLANDPASRTETGEIKDQAAPPTTAGTEPATTTAEAAKPATETKPEPKPDDKTALLNDKPVEGPPEKYEAFKVPDGFTLDEKVATEAGTLFKELGLSQANAQRLVDFHASKLVEANDASIKLVNEMRAKWRSEVESDPGVGNRLKEIKTNFGRMLDGLGDTKLANDFREAMNETGAGDHPAFVRLMDKLSLRFTEGKGVSGTAPAATGQARPGSRPPSAAAAMYPNLPSSA